MVPQALDTLLALSPIPSARLGQPGSPMFCNAAWLKLWPDGALPEPKGASDLAALQRLMAASHDGTQETLHFQPPRTTDRAPCTAGVIGLRVAGQIVLQCMDPLFDSRRMARMEATLNALPDALFELDEDGRFLDFHEGRVTRPALAPELFLGRTLEAVMPPDVAAIGRKAMREVDADGVSSGHQYALEDDGDQRWFELTASAIPGPVRSYVFLVRDITRRVQAQEAAEQERRQLRTVAELTPHGIVQYDVMGQAILDANAAAQRILGYSHDELVGRSLRDGITPENLVEQARIREQLNRKGSFGPIDYQLPHADGTPVPCRVSGVEVADAAGNPILWLVLEDISEQRARERRLATAEAEATLARQRLLTAVESLSDGFILYDAQDRLVLANASYRELYGHSGPIAQPGARFEDIVRHCLAAGDYPEAAGQEEAFVASRLALHREASGFSQYRLRDGRVVRVLERRTPDGGTVGLHVVVTELQEARDRALDASAAKTAFLANLSHEIRTPLTGILGMTDLLSEQIHTPAQRKMLEAISESGRCLLAILNDLLDMAKIESGKLTLESIAFVPARLLDPVCTLYAMRAEQKGLSFCQEIDPAMQAARLGDPHRLSQILHNLLSNALKFTETGSIGVRLEPGPEDGIRLVVSDTGIGMSPEQASRLFRPFEQADVSTARRYGGTGLGTSIVNELVRLMGGQIRVETEPGEGTRFIVELPLPRVQAEPEPVPVAPAAPVASGQPLDGRRVLIADDSEINRTILTAYLTGMGAQVTAAEDGEQAAQVFRPDALDAVCLDILMPGLDGIATLERLRAASHAAGIAMPRAVAITGNTLSEQVAECLAAGFDACLPKPFSRTDLAAALSVPA